MNDTGKVLFAALVGAAAGVLLAPASGKETRQKLNDKAEELGDNVKDFAEKSKEKYNEFKEAAKEKVSA